MAIPTAWVKFKDVQSSAEGSALCTFLEQNGVPAHLEQFGELPGLEQGAIVAVPDALLHRAQWLTADQELSDEELTRFALGELFDGGQE